MSLYPAYALVPAERRTILTPADRDLLIEYARRLIASAGIATLDVASLVRLHGLGVWSRLIAIGSNPALPLNKDKVRMRMRGWEIR